MKWANDEEHFARHIAADLRADGKPSLSQHFRRAPLPRSLKQRFSARHLFGETHGGPWVRIDSERFPLPVLAFSKADVLRVSDSLDRVRVFPEERESSS